MKYTERKIETNQPTINCMKLLLTFLIKNRLLKLLLIYFLSICVYAQQDISGLLPKYVPAAPNASSLFKFNNFQVDLYSGVPEISIPLYAIKMGEITVPINLSYHAAGIKVSENASWVGLGWALYTGGEVTRNVIGGADEASNGYLNNQIKEGQNIDITYPSASDLYYVAAGASGDEDYQPDMFSYNFPGKSGKFVFDGTDSNAIRLIPFSPINISTNSSEPISFHIKDELGYSFEFGDDFRDITNTSLAGEVTTRIISAWKLERITNPNGTDFIEYDYTSSMFPTFSGTLDLITVEDNVTYHSSPPYYYSDGIYQSSKSLNVSVNEAKLNEIRFKGGKVVFEQSSNDREDLESKSLNRIIVYALNSQNGYDKIKEILFNYSYFIQGTDNSTKRLRLDAIKIRNNDSSDEKVYSFVYNSTKLPKKTSRSQDYWGYYNGKTNSTLIPRQEITYISGVNNGGGSNTRQIGSFIIDSRFSVESYMKAAVLERIIYPTKGFTEFEYEANKYMKNGSELLAGGLRIKTIKSYKTSNDTEPLIKKYQYDESISKFHLSDYLFNTNQTYNRYEINSGGPSLAESKKVRNYIAYPSIDITPYDGMTVSYPKVTEYQLDGTVPNGKTIYEFRDYNDINSSSQASYALGRPVIISKFYNRGQISNKTIYGYNQSTENYYKIKNTSYTYSAFDQTLYENIGLVVSQKIINQGSQPSYGEDEPDERYSYSGYVIESDDNYLTSKIETVYDEINNPITTTTQYYYDNKKHQQITKQSVTTSDHKNEVVLTLFPQDYSNGTSFIDVMKNNGWNGYPIETVKYEIDELERVNIQEGTLTKYFSQGNGMGKKSELFLLERIQKVPLTEFNFSNRTSLGVLPHNGVVGAFNPSPLYKKRLGYDVYDEIGNLMEYNLTDGTSTVYLWGYNNQYLIAEIENSTSSQVAQALGLLGSQNLKDIDESDMVQIDGLRSSLTTAMITTYTYNPLIGVNTIKDPKGEVRKFIYDKFNRLKEIRDMDDFLVEDYRYQYKN